MRLPNNNTTTANNNKTNTTTTNNNDNNDYEHGRRQRLHGRGKDWDSRSVGVARLWLTLDASKMSRTSRVGNVVSQEFLHVSVHVLHSVTKQ